MFCYIMHGLILLHASRSKCSEWFNISEILYTVLVDLLITEKLSLLLHGIFLSTFFVRIDIKIFLGVLCEHVLPVYSSHLCCGVI